ncbi:hypothetical protein D9M69_703870 [compost metagenome]
MQQYLIMKGTYYTGVIGSLIAPKDSDTYQYLPVTDATAAAFIKFQDKRLGRWIKQTEFQLRPLPVIYTI